MNNKDNRNFLAKPYVVWLLILAIVVALVSLPESAGSKVQKFDIKKLFAAVKNDERSNTLMMTTPDKLRADAAKLDVFLEMFESTYFYFLDMAEGEAEKRDRGALAFYEIKDRVHALMGEMEEFAGHMEVCNAIFAVNFANREAEKGGAV